MKLSNTTRFDTAFLRRMTAWIRDQIGLPAAELRTVEFRNRSGHGVSGRAWSYGRILMRCTTHGLGYPRTRENHRGVNLEYPDELAALVYVTAHEIQHLMNWHTGMDAQLRIDRDLEAHCVRAGKRVMLGFLADRDHLEAAWNAKPKVRVAADPVDPIERKHAKAVADLARWERKLKLAKTKVSKYRARVKYYEKKVGNPTR